MGEGPRVRPALRFESLAVRRFLGLQRPDQSLLLGPGSFSPGVTLVAGPNGSGKTTAGLALSAVLWPSSSADPRGEVVAGVSLGGHSWTAEVFGCEAWWRCDGRRGDGPPLGTGLEPERYRLALPELLRAEDHDLAACICRELGGGYSLVEAARSLGFSASPPLPRQAMQRLRQARERVSEARREQAALQQLAGGLDGLRCEAEAALRAAREGEIVAALLDWRQAGRALAAARRQLAAFDTRCGRLRAQDVAQWGVLQREQGQAEAGGAAAARALAQAEAGLAARRGRPEPPTTAALRRARVRLQDLQSLEREGRQAECHLEGCRAREAAARGVLGERLSAEHLERLGRLQPDEGLAEAARSYLEASSRSAVLEHVRSLSVTSEAPPEEGALAVWRQGLDVLGAWLAEPAVVVSSGARRRAWAVVGLVVLAGLAAAVPALLWRRWALLVPALCSLLAGWLVRPRRSVVAASRRPALEEAYAGLGLEAPVAWDAPGVLAASAELSRRCGLAEARLRLYQEVQAVCRVLERDVAGRQRHHESVRRGVADRLGVAFADEPLAAWHLVSRIAAWQDARDARTQAEAAAAALAQRRTDWAGRLGAELGLTGAAGGLDSAAAAADLAALEAERQALDSACHERDRLAQDLAHERQRRDDLAARRGAFLNAVGLRPEEFPRADGLLRQWQEQSAACAAAQAAVAAAAAAVGRCRDEVRRLGGMDSRLRCRHTADLVRRHDELERTASRREEILRSIESIETRVREAKARHDLEGRLAECDEARAALEAQRGSGWQALAGQVSVETLTASLEDHASGVLQRAQESFAAITRGRYRLLAEAADGGAVLRARDGESGRLHDLDELSSGTRLQLLLAARLAFLAEREGEGPMLPLILDEVLGNSDDERAGTIMDIVIAAARQGRQVICFTAQSDELGKWQGRLQAAGVPWVRHWLPAGVAAPPAVPVAAPAWVPEPVPVPRPGEGAVDYAGRLRVPPLDPFETLPGSIHLAWIADDPAQLHALLAAGYRTWGALSLLLSLESGAAALRAGAPALADLDRDRLTARAEMLQHLLTLLRQGRRRRVSRAELRASGTVSARFLPEVEALLEASGGDGRELLRRLGEGAVRGFRRRQVGALETWLDEHGCRDDRPTLSLEELRAHLHARAAGYLVDGRLRLADVDTLVAQAADCLAGLEADAPRGTE